MFNDRSSIPTYLRSRRSGRPRDLVEPGPSAEELRAILETGMRTPDHGKLHPWRFVHVPRSARTELAALLRAAYLTANPNAGRLELEAGERFAHQAPELLVVLSSPVAPHKIPVWEQELSCGAAVMNLIHATHGLGYAAGWVTGWAAYSEMVLQAFGSPGERIAGFIFIGTPSGALEERPRPAYEDVARQWDGWTVKS